MAEAEPTRMETPGSLVKATLTELESLETVSFLWNPSHYEVEIARDLNVSPVIGGASGLPPFARGGRRRFRTRVLLDAGGEGARGESDLRAWVDRLERWSGKRPRSSGSLSEVLFSWGTFRFRGAIEELRQEWVRFAPDGTPLRVWIDIVLHT